MAATPETPETMRALNYVKANNIERILQDLDTLITNMEQAWFFSGALYAGETGKETLCRTEYHFIRGG